jgi:hypothetical protein
VTSRDFKLAAQDWSNPRILFIVLFINYMKLFIIKIS